MNDTPDLISTAVQALVANATRLGLTWHLRPATVRNADGANDVVVVQDGDTTSISATSITGAVAVGERVMCLLIPPSGNFIIGPLPSSNRASAYTLLTTVYYTAADTFDPDDFTGYRAVEVEVQAGGGGGAGVAATAAGQAAVGGGGGGGGYSRKFIPASSITGTVTVTVGGGGAGGAAGTNNGTAGSSSSFGSHCSATGGDGGTSQAPGSGASSSTGGAGGTGSSGDLNLTGGDGGTAVREPGEPSSRGFGGSSHFAGGRRGSGTANGAAGNAGYPYGGGGSGAHNRENQVTARAGGDGAVGIVIARVFT
jgi:hypothetical protein